MSVNEFALTADESFVRNCFVLARDGDAPLFIESGGVITAHLDGYVICAKERLKELADRSLVPGVDPHEAAYPV